MTVHELEIIPRRKLYQEVIDRLLEMIRSQRLPPGAPLPSERELIQRFGIGRPALREAMITLEGMGVVKLSNGKKARVATPTAQTIFDQMNRTVQHLLSTSPEAFEDLTGARVFFEVGLVRMAVERANAQDLARLLEALEAMRASKDDHTRFVRADMDFHATIAAVSGNPILSAVSRAMLDWLMSHRSELVRAAGAEEVTLREHAAIFDRILARDADGAALAMTEHLTRANEVFRRYD